MRMRMISAGAFRVLALLLLVSVLSNEASAISIADLKVGNPLQNAVEKQLEKSLSQTLPIVLDANDALLGVDDASLPGGPFNGKLLHPTVADLSTPIKAGDYVVPVTAFCTQYSIHGPGGGYAYTLAPLMVS